MIVDWLNWSFDNKVKALTTAAGLWASACIGLVIGSGYAVCGRNMTSYLWGCRTYEW